MCTSGKKLCAGMALFISGNLNVFFVAFQRNEKIR